MLSRASINLLKSIFLSPLILFTYIIDSVVAKKNKELSEEIEEEIKKQENLRASEPKKTKVIKKDNETKKPKTTKKTVSKKETK